MCSPLTTYGNNGNFPAKCGIKENYKHIFIVYRLLNPFYTMAGKEDLSYG